eukprot:jgi/Botrbrau1/4973/Bobra.0396s0003.1
MTEPTVLHQANTDATRVAHNSRHHIFPQAHAAEAKVKGAAADWGEGPEGKAVAGGADPRSLPSCGNAHGPACHQVKECRHAGETAAAPPAAASCAPPTCTCSFAQQSGSLLLYDKEAGSALH